MPPRCSVCSRAEPCPAAETVLGAIWNGLMWLVGNILGAVQNLAYALTHPGDWLAFVPHVQLSGSLSDIDAAQSLIRFICYGALVELFFFVSLVVVILFCVGLRFNGFLGSMGPMVPGLKVFPTGSGGSLPGLVC